MSCEATMPKGSRWFYDDAVDSQLDAAYFLDSFPESPLQGLTRQAHLFDGDRIAGRVLSNDKGGCDVVYDPDGPALVPTRAILRLRLLRAQVKSVTEVFDLLVEEFGQRGRRPPP